MAIAKKYSYIPWMILSFLILGSFSFAAIAKEQRTSTLSLAVDRDQDGLSNKEEELYGTNPDVRDTDGDGYSDGVEVESGYDPLVPAAKGDRLMGITNGRDTSSADIAYSRNLTNELRTRVAGIAFDVVNGKQVTLDDVDKEIESLLEKNAVDDLDDVTNVDVNSIRVKKQDYKDMSAKERKKQVKKDVTTYVTALTYVVSLYAPQSLNSSEDINTFAQEIVAQTSSLEDDYTNTAYFEQFIPRGEKMLAELNNIEVPEVMLPLHVEGLKIAHMAIAIGKSFQSISPDDPAGAALVFSRARALVALMDEFSEKVTEEINKYGITL